MLLLIVVVQQEDAPKLASQLVALEYRLTQVKSTGGFLAAGNAVLLLGVAEERLPDVIATIEKNCQTRVRYVNATPWPGAVGLPAIPTVAPMEVLVGGAVVFGLPVRRFVRLQGGTAPPITDLHFPIPTNVKTEFAPAATPGKGAVMPEEADRQLSANLPPTTAMSLVVAILQSEDADAVGAALIAANHRLTRLNSAGGFFHRGNATLLIGVEPAEVENVLALIQANSRSQTEPNPPEKGMPMYSATVFVLDASHFMRI